MPIIPGMIETLDFLKELHRKKNDDYSGAKGPFYNFEFTEFITKNFSKDSDKIFATMIGIKLARLSVLLSTDNNPNNESVLDSFNDLITYCAIWKCSKL